MKINIPKDVQLILDKLGNSGFESYIVGGCVRDSIMGRAPNDWDITTNATPSEVKEVFRDGYVLPTGEIYGTVTVMLNNEGYEVTTYRSDGNYSDGRRPDKVTFSNNILDDLSRRDFTINAMAYNEKLGLIDPYKGQRDIQDRVIRCVGNPYTRFKEDALRIMRMFRFAARYCFSIDDITKDAAISQINTLNNVSEERINKELKEIIFNIKNLNDEDLKPLLLQIIPELRASVDCEQNNPYHYLPVYDHIIKSCRECKPDASVETKIALLLHDIGKPYCYSEDKDGVGHFYGHGDISSEMAARILKRLKFSNKETELITSLVRYHDRPIEPRKKSVKRALTLMGEDVFKCLLDVREGDILAQACDNGRLEKLSEIRNVYQEIIKQKECFSIKDLSINGKDIIEYLGIEPGQNVGLYLKQALEFVEEDNSRNNKNDIMNYLKLIKR